MPEQAEQVVTPTALKRIDGTDDLLVDNDGVWESYPITLWAWVERECALMGITNVQAEYDRVKAELAVEGV